MTDKGLLATGCNCDTVSQVSLTACGGGPLPGQDGSDPHNNGNTLYVETYENDGAPEDGAFWVAAVP